MRVLKPDSLAQGGEGHLHDLASFLFWDASSIWLERVILEYCMPTFTSRHNVMFEACPVIPDSLPYTATQREKEGSVIYAIVA